MKRDNFSFKVLKRSKKSKARLGVLKTPHGQIKTPAFVTVGTKATVKSLTPEDLNKIGSQIIFVNTYHTVLSPGVDLIKKAGGIHQYTGIEKPVISDSGGFQVFSLARQSHVESKLTDKKRISFRQNEDRSKTLLVKITSDGVEFRSTFDGRKFYFTPEFSIEAQRKIGADFMVTFDECTYYKASYKYTKEAMQRTHSWALRSLKAFSSQSFNVSRLRNPYRKTSEVKGQKNKKRKTKPSDDTGSDTVRPEPINQRLFGVIQGGMYEDLRKKSTQFIASLPFFGLAIGGVSVGETKRQMREQIFWAMEVIEKDKRPRHLLGVGQIDDIFDTILMGVDMMDCVIPTRHARMGKLYQDKKLLKIKDKKQISKISNENLLIDMMKSKYKDDLRPVDEECGCYTCANFTRSYLHHLFKQKELLVYRLATIHNLYFMEKLFEKIREGIASDII